MHPASLSLHLSRLPRLIFLSACLLAAVVVLVTPTPSQTLTPQKTKEMTDLGCKVADAERKAQDIDKALSKPNLDPDLRDRLQKEKADAERSKQANEGTAENVEGKDSDAYKVFEKARDARRKQYELDDAKKAAQGATGEDKKRADRRINRLQMEFDDAKKGIGELSELPIFRYASAGGTTITGTAAYALLEQECKKHIMLSSVDSGEPSWLAGRELARNKSFALQHMKNPLLRLVQGNPPKSSSSGAEPTNEQAATRIADQIKDELRQELGGDLKEYNDLDKIKPEDRTPAQETRRQEIKTKVENAVQSKRDEILGSGKFADKPIWSRLYVKLKDFDEELLGKGGMTQIDLPTMQIGGATGGATAGPPTTRVSGNATFFKGQVQGPGDLELEDRQGNRHNIYVDKDGSFSKDVETPNFKPIKFTFESASGTWIWRNGQWQQQIPNAAGGGSGEKSGTTGTKGPAPQSPTGSDKTAAAPGKTADDPDPTSIRILRNLKIPLKEGGGMTQIDPPNTPTNRISGNFGQLPPGFVPEHVDVVDRSGQTIRLTVGSDGKFEGQIPQDFVPVKQILHVIGTDGKPYIANYELIGGAFRPVGKFQQAGPTNEELHQEMIEHGTGYEPMRPPSKSLRAPTPAKADGGPGTTGQITGAPPPKKVSFNIQTTPIPGLASAPQPDGDSSLTFAFTNEWTASLDTFSLKHDIQWINYDVCGPTTAKPNVDGSIDLKGIVSYSSNLSAGLRWTPRINYQIGEDSVYADLNGSTASPGGTRWSTSMDVDYAYKIGIDNIPEAKVTFKPTLNLGFDRYNDIWMGKFDDAKARDAAGETAQGFRWQYHGQALGEGRIGFSHWSTTQEIHDTFVHKDAFSRNWESGEKDGIWSAAPVSSLHPAHWPHTDAFALPRVEIRMEAP